MCCSAYENDKESNEDMGRTCEKVMRSLPTSAIVSAMCEAWSRCSCARPFSPITTSSLCAPSAAAQAMGA